ncbi:MAG: glycosyltransferase, partial [Acidobacteria bacterium]|nr:glycosyltransferase [Acidobacteriota bacterium]
MRVLIASEARFGIAPDGTVYTEGAEDYAFWSAYRQELDQVGVLARVRAIDAPGNRSRACGPGVVFHPLPDYRGPWQYLLRLFRLRRAVRRAVRACDAFVLRAPGAVAYLAWREIRRQAKPYAVEVLGDPWESLAGISALARRWSRRWLLRLCRQAPVVSYVTRRWLQQQYPPGPATAVFVCSDVRLASRPDENPLNRRLARLEQASQRPWEIGFIGSLERLYKAPDVHLRAMRLCLDHGLSLRFSILGDGRCRPALERLSQELGFADHVRFLGAVPPGAVNDFLDQIDLFVLASRTEGFPRALVEAMARACPAIGSTAGGIPELLAPDDLVEPGRAGPLAARIAEVLGDPARLAAMARRNLAMAGLFQPESLAPVRRAFLDELRRLARPKLVHVTTVDRFWPLLDGQAAYMQARGFDFHAVSSPGPLLDRFARDHHVRAWPISMSRAITPWQDLVALWRLWRLFARLRPRIVHAHTPKAGLLAMLAARAARTPARFYTLHGLVWQTRRGLRRRLLVTLDRLACRLASRVLAVSASVRQRAIEAGLAPPEKIRLAGNGSANGLDFERFDPVRVDPGAGAGLRVQYGIPAGAPVVGLVGRLVPDKGLAELDAAWQQLRRRFPSLHLLLAGETEAHDPLPAPLWSRLRSDPRVHFCGWQAAMPEHYCLMGVCVLPSRREGLPYAALEAAAMSRPVAAFAVDGVVDAVEHGATGLLAPPGDAA